MTIRERQYVWMDLSVLASNDQCLLCYFTPVILNPKKEVHANSINPDQSAARAV